LIVMKAEISRPLTCLDSAVCRIAISIPATPADGQFWERRFPQMGKSGGGLVDSEGVNQVIKLLWPALASGTGIDKRNPSRKARRRLTACATIWPTAH